MDQIAVSVIVPVYNDETHIGACIASLLGQTLAEFELIIIDDGSQDDTSRIIEAFQDERIVHLRNQRNMGAPAARNHGIEHAHGRYIFFTDADCVVSDDWLAEGLSAIEGSECVGVEGRLYFVSPDYRPVYSDRVVENRKSGEYMTANMAYRKDVLLKVGLFDPRFRRHQDLDIALKARSLGPIAYAPRMMVFHARTRWTPRSYLESARSARYIVLLFQLHPHALSDLRIFHRFYAPEKLLTILFPPLVLLKLLTDHFRSADDWRLFMLIYPRLVYERLLLWKFCVEERVFLI